MKLLLNTGKKVANNARSLAKNLRDGWWLYLNIFAYSSWFWSFQKMTFLEALDDLLGANSGGTLVLIVVLIPAFFAGFITSIVLPIPIILWREYWGQHKTVKKMIDDD